MIETHPFKVFCPSNAKYLILGSFVAKGKDSSYDWYYSNGRNQFWFIFEKVYGIELSNKKVKQDLFARLAIAITDIIYQCERLNVNSSLDKNLTNFVYNTQAITKVLRKNPIKKIFFSSRFVEKEFRKNFKDLIEEFPNVKLVTLPSSSPRYAAMSKLEKIKKYKELLPFLK